MNSAYGLPDMSQQGQVPIGGGPGYQPAMPPGSGSGAGPGSIHHHPSYQHHQPLPPPQHQQPQSHASPHPQGPAQGYPHPHPHQHQHQHHQAQSHHQQHQQEQEQQQRQQNALQHSLQHSHQHPLLNQHQHQHQHQHQQLPHQHQLPHQLSHLHHLSHQPPPQPQHLPQQHEQHHHRQQLQLQLQKQQHVAQPKTQTQPPAGRTSRSRDLSTTPTAGASIHPDQQGGAPKTLIPLSKLDETTGRKYQLDVVQQPRRARMCGFGDKDRRPITPPPCVRLIITDMITGKEVDCNDIDHSMFVLNVDLWNEDGSREVNLVRSSASSPSISSTTPYSYTALNGGDIAPVPYSQHVLPSGRDSAYNPTQPGGFVQDYQVQPYSQASTPYPPNGTYGPPQQYFPQHQSYRSEGGVPSLASQANMAPFGRNGGPVTGGYGQDQSSLTRMAMVGGQPQGMFTRNLIGSLAASAFRLSDTSDQIGIWFVLQDLSVRTEGPFRLRFSFVNVGPRGGTARDGSALRVNTGRAPILASCFSDVFTVYSAKKFPGVCESTPLSKTFATQGIKIPIRKDANVKGGDGEDDYGD